MQIAKNFGINDKTIYNWIKVYKKENNITTPIDETKNQSKSSQQELLAELKQLRAENKLLKQERDILKASAIVAREHHEKWDGSGYPRGLIGKDIHIYGRITAIADVFDALAHDRVYKKAWALEKIYDLLKEEKGKHFDPELIDIFFNNLDKFLEIKELLND